MGDGHSDESVAALFFWRVSREAYDYEAPVFDYRGRLRVSPQGGVVHYPGLFERVSR